MFLLAARLRLHLCVAFQRRKNRFVEQRSTWNIEIIILRLFQYNNIQFFPNVKMVRMDIENEKHEYRPLFGTESRGLNLSFGDTSPVTSVQNMNKQTSIISSSIMRRISLHFHVWRKEWSVTWLSEYPAGVRNESLAFLLALHLYSSYSLIYSVFGPILDYPLP